MKGKSRYYMLTVLSVIKEILKCAQSGMTEIKLDSQGDPTFEMTYRCLGGSLQELTLWKKGIWFSLLQAAEHPNAYARHKKRLLKNINSVCSS